MIQSRHGVYVPAVAEFVEIDGLLLPLTDLASLTGSTSPVVFLPRGVHAVRFRRNELPVEVTVAGEFFAEYQALRTFFVRNGQDQQHEELLARAARTMDVHGAPFLLNQTGALHASLGEWDAAARYFRRALLVNPAFSPAHLNLAQCLMRRSDRIAAAQECVLAEAFNVGNVFGLKSALTEMRRQLGRITAEPQPLEMNLESYLSRETIEEEDRRLVAILQAASKYAVGDDQRGKILNNVGVHFAESGRPELALFHFRSALGCVRTAGSERFQLARTILGNMRDVCRKAQFTEADEYERMQNLVTP